MRKDTQIFSQNLMASIILLHNDLSSKRYRHSSYEAFNISDPRPRNIHKASVRDRLLHHAVYRILYPYFDKKFIHDSYTCRNLKGTHRALNRFRTFARKVSKNGNRTCWVLKCDIRKFFASIDHAILFEILSKHVSDSDTISLLRNIIGSFNSFEKGKGLPLGNLTSQLLVNIYMNEFDQFMKHVMKVKYYIRYADDFVILDEDKDYLLELTPKIADFLEDRLKLSLHPDKLFIRNLNSGVDFLGWIHFFDHRVLRPATKRRILKRVTEKNLSSYLGLCSHGNTYKLRTSILYLLLCGYTDST